MRCPECRQEFTRIRSDQVLCSAECNKAQGNRELRRARALYRALYHWRLDRKSAKANLGFICRSVADWIREDREHQRLPPPRHNHGKDLGYTKRKPLVPLSFAIPREKWMELGEQLTKEGWP